MKKLIGVFIGIAAIGIVAILSMTQLSLSAIDNDNKHDVNISEMSERVGMKLSEEDMLYGENNHGGMQNDGVTYACFKVDKLSSSKNFKKLPLSLKIKSLIYYDEKDIKEDEKTIIPEIKNGYYYFYNLSDAKNHEEIESLSSEDLSNYYYVIYDSDAKKLYYYNFDL